MSGEIDCAATVTCVKLPVLKTSKSGRPFCTFSGVTGEGEAKKFVRVVCFNEIAERVAAQLQVAGRAYVEGALDAGLWTPEGGETRLNLSIAARRVEVLNQIGRNRPKRPPDDAGPSAKPADDRGFDDQIPY